MLVNSHPFRPRQRLIVHLNAVGPRRLQSWKIVGCLWTLLRITIPHLDCALSQEKTSQIHWRLKRIKFTLPYYPQPGSNWNLNVSFLWVSSWDLCTWNSSTFPAYSLDIELTDLYGHRSQFHTYICTYIHIYAHFMLLDINFLKINKPCCKK